jgi:hypothetical protein
MICPDAVSEEMPATNNMVAGVRLKMQTGFTF